MRTKVSSRPVERHSPQAILSIDSLLSVPSLTSIGRAALRIAPSMSLSIMQLSKEQPRKRACVPQELAIRFEPACAASSTDRPLVSALRIRDFTVAIDVLGKPK